MFDDYLVTIIIPTYNAEATLQRCLDSLCGQTYKNLEIILVDDGSTDATASICDINAKEDARIRVIHQSNKGVAGATNVALDIAKGDFYLFVDSDDALESQCVADTLKALIDYDVDVVQFGRISLSESGKYLYQDMLEHRIFNDNTTILKALLVDGYIGNNLACKLFKAKLFDGIRLEAGRQLVDSVTVPRVLLRCRNYLIFPKNYYFAYRLVNSVSRGYWNDAHYDDFVNTISFMQSFFRDNLHEEVNALYIFQMRRAMHGYCQLKDSRKKVSDYTHKKTFFLRLFKDSHSSLAKTDWELSLSSKTKLQIRLFSISPMLFYFLLKVKNKSQE